MNTPSTSTGILIDQLSLTVLPPDCADFGIEASVWIVQRGSAELQVRILEGSRSESTHSIARFDEGDVLFSFPGHARTTGFNLQCSTAPNSEIRRITKGDLNSYIEQSKISPTQLQALLTLWFSSFTNRSIGKGFSLNIDGEVTIEILADCDLTSCDSFWLAIKKFHEILLAEISRKFAVVDTVEQAKLVKKIEAQDLEFENSLEELASILNGPSIASQISARPLQSVCSMIFSAMGIQSHSEQNDDNLSDSSDLEEKLRSICRARGVSKRKVKLKGQWWTQDSGPLLAFQGDSNRPVAILPRKGGGYRLADPDSLGSHCRVNASVARSLSPFAFMFYRSFPSKSLKLWDVIVHGVKNQKSDLLKVVLYGLMAGLLGMAIPLATGIVYDSIIPSSSHDQLVQLCALLLASVIGIALLNLSRSITLWRIETKATFDVEAAIWNRIVRLPASFFRDYSAGDLTMRAYRIDAIRSILSGTVLSSAFDAVFSVVYLLLLFLYSPTLAWWAFGLVCTASSAIIALNLSALKHDRIAHQLSLENSGRTLELLGGITKIRASASEKIAFSIWAKIFGAQRQSEFRARLLNNAAACIGYGLPLIATAFIFYQYERGQFQSSLPTGQFLAFFVAFTVFLGSMLSLSNSVASFTSIIPLYENAKPILKAVPEVTPQQIQPGKLRGAVEFSQVSFRYAENLPDILQSLSFQVFPGEFVAFVGASGAGKSTVFRLLLGFETPREGSIYLDGQDISNLDSSAVRQQMGVVLQNGKLLPGTIFDNIIGGSGTLTVEDAWEAVRMSGLEEDIRAMPMGMHTFVSEGGGTLSGGQLQRLLIARAIIKRPRILLMDEATSALDNRSQDIVRQSLDQLNATRIVIAHRLSTIKHADRIFYLDHGRVVEAGNYEELMARGDKFYSLANRQIA